MQSQDFEEVQIKPAAAGPGHNQPPPDAPAVPPEQELAERLARENKPLVDKVGEYEGSLQRLPEAIENAEQAGKVADFLAMVKDAQKRNVEAKEKSKRPILVLGRVVDNFHGGIEDRLLPIRRKLLALSDGWQAKLRAKAAEEAAAKAAEERRQAEASRKLAEQAAEAGKMEVAAAQVQEAQRADNKAAKSEQAAAAPPPKAAAVVGTVGRVQSRTTWEFEIKDLKKLDAQYLLPNMALIRAQMNALNKSGQLQGKTEDETLIAGVRLYQKTSAV